jgi:endonuclease/exonuclease/phosphatase (EEP) superfamily protein YafD
LAPTRIAARATIGAAALLAAATAAGRAGQLHWSLDLFSHFSWQLLAAQCAVLAGLLIVSRPRFALALLPFIALNVHAVLPYVSLPGAVLASAADERSLTLLAVNVAAHNYRFAGLRASILAEQPDVVLVVELTPRWAGRLREIRTMYPYRIEHVDAGAAGIGLYSRLPLTDSATVDLVGRPMIVADADTGSTRIRIFGVHLATPVSPEGGRNRAVQLEQLKDRLLRTEGPAVVLGDFNLSTYSPVFRSFLRETGFVDSLQGRGPDISWPTWLPWFGIPIDHCLVSASLTVLEHERLGHFGSDHWPILARIGW